MLSIVVPCFNEEGGLNELRVALIDAVSDVVNDFEVLLVDDGSTDGTLAEMRQISALDQRFRYLSLSRNFGKESAMLAGLSHTRGDIVAMMDADLQHPPALLPTMLGLLREGHDQVVARRTRTGDPRFRTRMSRLYYRAVNRMVDVELTDGVGDFRVMSRRAVDAILSLDERTRFSKGLFAWIGFDTAVVEYENADRFTGATKWNLRGLVNYGVDGMLSFNNRPLRTAVHLGLVVTVLAFAYAVWVLTDAIVSGNAVPGYTTIMCGVLFLGGLQLLFLGVIGEYVGRIFYETKRRPHFLIKDSSPGDRIPVTVSLGTDAIRTSPSFQERR